VLGRLGVSRRTEQELQGVALRIDGSVERGPGCFDFDIRFIHAPGIVTGFQLRPRALFQFWGRVLDPTVNGGVCHSSDLVARFCHD
jgi:hypothetical protein